MKNRMGFILLKKFIFLFLVVSAAVLSTAFAGRLSKSVVSKDMTEALDHQSWEAPRHDGMRREIHERLLKVKTDDYGKYDPSPSFVKPPFKLIPN
ncbi:protein CASPARIAN STRIP INTEGRITY FACTOR 1 [Andrographis paniculata]|uniref:protein CASPARIAN STRIP INTEGRITY FACTOR 1 n=1 Tax=Andrographis paniculata TaxID=175694 RepID=UPI0021E868DB|nr:protein CASPARIAN STRIP INTEGRITY FACTOR 1 [Andrographis paniculata]